MFKSTNPLFRFAEFAMDLIVLNFLYIACSLPIISFGISETALYATLFRRRMNAELNVFSCFFSQIRENWRASLSITCLLFLCIPVYLGLILLCLQSGFLNALPVKIILIIIALILLGQGVWSYPLQARFQETLPQLLKNAYYLSIRHLPITILLLLLRFGVPICVIFLPPALMNGGLFLSFFLGSSLSVWLCSYLLDFTFQRYADPPSEA